MSEVINFSPIAANCSIVLSVAASAHTAVQLTNLDNFAGGEILLSNQGTTVWIFVSLSTTSASDAQTKAAIPTDGNAGEVIPVPPGWQIAVTVPFNVWVSAIGSAAGPTNLWITQGIAKR